MFGSDWPVVTIDPMIGIHNAVLRQNTDGTPEGGWVPAQRVTLEQAIAAYTLSGAYGSFEEDVTGEIHKARVTLTVFNGREVYRTPAP